MTSSMTKSPSPPPLTNSSAPSPTLEKRHRTRGMFYTNLAGSIVQVSYTVSLNWKIMSFFTLNGSNHTFSFTNWCGAGRQGFFQSFLEQFQGTGMFGKFETRKDVSKLVCMTDHQKLMAIEYTMVDVFRAVDMLHHAHGPSLLDYAAYYKDLYKNFYASKYTQYVHKIACSVIIQSTFMTKIYTYPIVNLAQFEGFDPRNLACLQGEAGEQPSYPMRGFFPEAPYGMMVLPTSTYYSGPPH